MQFIKQKLPAALKSLKEQLHEEFTNGVIRVSWWILVALLWLDGLLTGIWFF